MKEPARFGARLRQQREERGITLRSIAESTKVSASYFAALERGDCSRWPAGVYSRAFVRGYAEAIGLDPDTVASDFFQCFPGLVAPAAHPATAAAVPAMTAPQAAIAGGRAELRLMLADSPGERARERAGRMVRVLTELGAMLVLAAIIGAANGRFWMALAIALVTRQIVGALTVAPAADLHAPGKDVEAPAAPLPDAEPVG